ncbi:GumC family protein [Maribacter sp. 2308TA10-17]|uniref:GumC family protein n=1 Tax=Maribacter sp. 2308TA10-17 TaxID=3386276 RepID=UPI0039BD2848
MDEVNKSSADENILRMLLAMFLPYWPLFALLIPVCIIGAWGYLKTTTPVYEAAATLIIKDENKGVDDSKVLEAMNPFDSKKIVENELEIIKSRTIMTQVVKNLQLYAPVYEDKLYGSKEAYTTSPIVVELRNPENIVEPASGKSLKFYFEYDSLKNLVKIKNKSYPIDEWVEGPVFGETKFKLNANRSRTAKRALYFSFVHPKNLTRGLLSGLEASPTDKLSTVVRLTYRDPIPQRGENILNHLIAAYNQKAISDRDDLASNTLTFIDDRMKKVEKELNELESSIQRFRSEKGVVDLSEQGKLYLYDVGEYDRQIASISRQLAVLNKVDQYVISKKNQAGIVPATLGVEDRVLSQLLEKLYTSEMEYEKLRKTTAENNPILTAVADEINKIRPSIRENIRNQKNNLRASLGSLNFNANQSASALKNIPEKERALLEIERGKEIKNELYSFLQQKREETALSYAPNGGDGRIVDLAESSEGPVSPKSSIIYLVALILGFGIGLGYIIFKEMMNRNVLFRSEIENSINTPVVLELPHLDDVEESKKPSSAFSYITNKLGINFIFSSNKKTSEIKQNEAVLLNHFRQLGSSMGLYDRNFTKKKILITSSIEGEGKSFVGTNLAYCLAQSGKKVALVDMDFLKPQTSRSFGILKHKGVLDYLSYQADYKEILTNSHGNKNLFIVPVGNRVDDHTQLLLNGKLDVLFEELSDEFDYVIIDSAPVNLVADVKLLADYCDETIYVILQGKTPLKVLRHLDDSETLKNLKNVSVVFNGIKQRGLVKGNYNYGYGYNTNLYEEEYGSEIASKL